MSKFQEYLDTKPELTHTVVAYLVRGDEVLLGVRKRVSDGLGELIVAGIGGRLESGENEDQALVRELQEEIEVTITSWRRVGQSVCLSPHSPKWNLLIGIYIVDAWQGEPQETDDIKPLWFPKTELPTDRMWADNLITAPLVLDGKRIQAEFLYEPGGTVAEYRLEELSTDAQL